MIAILICLAGGLGAALRYIVDSLISRRLGSLPIGIAFVNVSGSLVIGIASGALGTHGDALAVVATGFCGGYTTFSTAMADVIKLGRNGRGSVGAALAILTLGLSVLAAACGVSLGSYL